MQSERSADLRTKYQAEQLLGPWISALDEATCASERIDRFVDPIRTRELREAFFVVVRDCHDGVFHRVWPASDMQSMSQLIQSQAARLPDRECVLLSSVDALIGAPLVRPAPILQHFCAVWKVVEEDLCLLDEDGSAGFCLEFNVADADRGFHPDGYYELTAWGWLAPAPSLGRK